jgi:ubiquinone/menaquinone biosynthesis C-methylase UbiE
VDRELISSVAHRWHPIAAPLSKSSVSTLIHRAAFRPGDHVLDLGCGQGAWLVDLLEQQPDVTAVGVDRSAAALATARAATSEGLDGRVEWVEADAATWRGNRFDVVLCVGASHVFGGLSGMLTALRRHLAPGGRVIVGDTIWDVPPSPGTLEVLEADADDFPDAAGLLAAAREQGLEPSYGHISSLAEWDEYEWSWTGALTQWALTEATTADQRREALEIAAEHRTAWLDGYRGELGFATVVLHDVSAA